MIEGLRALGDLLAAGAEITELFIDQREWDSAPARSPLREVVGEAGAAGVGLWGVAPEVLARMADTVAPQGLIAVAPLRTVPAERLLAESELLLVLVDVGDPGNVGTLVRSAAGAGCGGVVVAGSTADPFGPKAVRAAAGALGRVKVAECADPVTAVRTFRDGSCRLVAAVAAGGVPPDTLDLTGSVALVIGGEARGIAPEVLALCGESVTIPMASGLESLNASVAGSLLLFESARQRRQHPEDAEVAVQ